VRAMKGKSKRVLWVTMIEGKEALLNPKLPTIHQLKSIFQLLGTCQVVVPILLGKMPKPTKPSQ
jgi:hypothetical protein